MNELQQSLESLVANRANVIVTETQRKNDRHSAESAAIQFTDMIVIQVDVL